MSLPWLVADIGGTNARFGLVTEPGGQPQAVAVLAGADHDGLPEAVAAYLADHAGGVQPGAACIAIAGPVEGDRYRLTNAGWAGSVRDLGIPNAELLNDFEALAASLPHLVGDDLVSLGGPAPSRGVKAVLGPGTGLGVGGLVPAAEGWVPIPGEGGHVTVPVLDERDHAIVQALRAEGLEHVVAEHLLSGPGLTRLHHGLALVHGVDAPRLSASDIVARLDDSLCAETVEVFCGMLGTFAGNVALTLGARGGVYLGGGVLPRIVDRVRSSDFRRRFEATPTLNDYLSAIATTLIVAPQPALVGAAAWLNQRLSNMEYV
ncbi:glucokinase [Streptosporangium roseum]|uniref:Glucokinase n=1 Tax=Streptosporangium roseum (strain ATCC 12428 / DSM 43021 / JCM 3005 / KCTC 9067 / NCIMB 10171 / NRRL 2505 / NI 9100) TaxID=479432 RepID=D2BEV0_STRRD|nr:glucokinase [Streptosporangium roseum]ACZ86311.1 Glucokinase [Streptosporangium roseum DSM 43021]